MSRKPVDVVKALLADPVDPGVVNALVAADATYVSLNFQNADLTRIMPWAGTHTSAGPQSIVKTFTDVARFWKVEAFEVQHAFGDDEKAAVFGSFTYRSTVLGRLVTSPFAIMATVKDGKITYMRFMEDTFATAASFQMSGQARYHSNPDGEPFDISGPESTS